MKRIIVFGSFDGFHRGHEYFLQQAKKLGDLLTVVIARDEYIQTVKGRKSTYSEQDRIRTITQTGIPDAVLLGDAPNEYAILKNEEFDVLAVGYDQMPDDAVIRRLLESVDKSNVEIVRIESHKPEIYKSSLLRAPRDSK